MNSYILRYLLHFLCSKRLSRLGAEAMLHLDEVFCAEIYARSGIIVGVVKRGKEVLKPWVSSGVSFCTFLSLMKEKYKHSREILSLRHGLRRATSLVRGRQGAVFHRPKELISNLRQDLTNRTIDG